MTSCPDHPIPDRCQYTNHGDHQYQSMYTNQNRSYNSNYNQNYRETWENHTDRTCNNCGTKGHIAKYYTKTSLWCQWCHTATHDTQACRSKSRSSTPMESPISWIKTLQDAMDHAVKIDQESRQSKVIRNRRNNSTEIIDTTVNEISDIDINYIASRQGDSRFNSTMKPGYQRERKDFSPKNRQNDSFKTTEAGTALEMTTRTLERLTNTNIMLENLGTTSNLSAA